MDTGGGGGGGGKSSPWPWVIAIVIVVGFLLAKRTADNLTKTSSTTAAKNFGYGVGSGAVDSAGSALGKFFSGFFGGSSKSDGDAGGPVDISGSVDWDRNPPHEPIYDEESDYV